ncbi:MAG: hypothetical protein J1E36_04385 [Eubacterium sp.]|nr:hypothetical protein [Eubacterium sp.]
MANSPENKMSKALRTLLSFALFVMIVVLSLSASSKAVLLNKTRIIDMFTSYEYVSSVKNSVVEYASDIYLKNGLDASTLDEIFDYELIRDSIKSYVSNDLGLGSNYNESTYLEPIESICGVLQSDITKQIGEKKLNNNEEKVSHIVKSVEDFFVNEIDISVTNEKTMINMGSIALIVVICVSAFFTAATALVLAFIGTKRYRSIRAIGISFASAGLFDIISSIIIYIILGIKHIDIFPLYLRELVMDYIYTGLNSFIISGCFLLLVSLIFSVVVWKVRKEK